MKNSKSSDILLERQQTDFDVGDGLREKLFEADERHAWIDIYATEAHLAPARASSLLHFTEGEDTDIDYLGRCDVPFYRARNKEQYSDIGKHLASNAARLPRISGSHTTLFHLVRQRHSWSRLLTSWKLLEIAVGEPQLDVGMALEGILGFGPKIEDTDIGGPPCWYAPSLDSTTDPTALKQRYNCGYTLKYVELNRRKDEERPWSERQSCIMFFGGKDTWTLISPSTRMQTNMAEYFKSLGHNEVCNTFVLHLSFIGAAMSNWRPYLAYLTHEVNDQIRRVVSTNIDTSEDLDGIFNLLTVTDRQRFRLLEDRVSNMFVMLDATSNTVASLQEKYHIFFLGHDKVEMSAARDDTVAYAFGEKLREIAFTRQQLQALHERVKSGVQLLSSLLDLENGKSLRKIAEESRQENAMMVTLSKRATTDASAVKVITIITLLYLPTSVVTSFFSTTFVSSQQRGSERIVAIADNWWVLLAVIIPLTTCTCVVWLMLQYRMKCIDVLLDIKSKASTFWRVDQKRRLSLREQQKSTC